MNARDIYCVSQSFRAIVAEVAARVVESAGQPVRPVEYIVLPEFGQFTILRFGLSSDRKLSFQEADALETHLRNRAGPQFWVTLIGSCFRDPVSNITERLAVIGRETSLKLPESCRSEHSDLIREDGCKLRNLLKLPAESSIWEIEVPMSEDSAEIMISIIGARSGEDGQPAQPAKERIRIGDTECRVVYLPGDPSFTGALKAYCAAERNHVALASYVAQFACGFARPGVDSRSEPALR